MHHRCHGNGSRSPAVPTRLHPWKSVSAGVPLGDRGDGLVVSSSAWQGLPRLPPPPAGIRRNADSGASWGSRELSASSRPSHRAPAEDGKGQSGRPSSRAPSLQVAPRVRGWALQHQQPLGPGASWPP